MDEKFYYPKAAKATTEDTYMDDVITGADSMEEARELCRQLDEMTAKGGFRLRKWASNHPDVLKDVPEDNLAIRVSEGISLDPDPIVKALGLTWMPTTDQLKFQFTIPAWNTAQQPTKRQVLSVIASLFDPLGLLGAAITSAKVIMQLQYGMKRTSRWIGISSCLRRWVSALVHLRELHEPNQTGRIKGTGLRMKRKNMDSKLYEWTRKGIGIKGKANKDQVQKLGISGWVRMLDSSSHLN